ncbi:MAG: hypothetical protein FJ102_22485 [Deltaproteobacteria bacterium]|nr:hypothetical protein [Deltaproteobacteria bacterium]
MGTLQTPDGPERIRGALVIDDPYQAGEGSLVVVTNSPLVCDVDVEDDPATVRDEEAEARAWWADSLDAAAKREGAVLVAFFLGSLDGEQELGLGGNGWAAYRVLESGWDDGERVVYADELVQRGVGTATASPRGDAYDVEFEVQGYSASFAAAPCDEPALTGAIAELYASF